jgi:hypothetical protein
VASGLSWTETQPGLLPSGLSWTVTQRRMSGHLRIMHPADEHGIMHPADEHGITHPADEHVRCFSWGTVSWRVVALMDQGTLFGVRVKQKL